MNKIILIGLFSVGLTAAAFATTPSNNSDSVDSAQQVKDIQVSSTPTTNGGVYDTEALMCMEAAPETEASANEVRCWKCGSGSSDGCSGGDKHCYGERSDCQKKGCKITGSTSTCSSSKKTC